MSDLEWTDEPPEEEGWYWLKTGEGPPASPRIIEVRPSYADEDADIQLLVADPADSGVGIRRALYEYGDVKWAGPIPEPKE